MREFELCFVIKHTELEKIINTILKNNGEQINRYKQLNNYFDYKDNFLIKQHHYVRLRYNYDPIIIAFKNGEFSVSMVSVINGIEDRRQFTKSISSTSELDIIEKMLIKNDLHISLKLIKNREEYKFDKYTIEIDDDIIFAKEYFNYSLLPTVQLTVEKTHNISELDRERIMKEISELKMKYFPSYKIVEGNYFDRLNVLMEKNVLNE